MGERRFGLTLQQRAQVLPRPAQGGAKALDIQREQRGDFFDGKELEMVERERAAFRLGQTTEMLGENVRLDFQKAERFAFVLGPQKARGRRHHRLRQTVLPDAHRHPDPALSFAAQLAEIFLQIGKGRSERLFRRSHLPAEQHGETEELTEGGAGKRWGVQSININPTRHEISSRKEVANGATKSPYRW